MIDLIRRIPALFLLSILVLPAHAEKTAAAAPANPVVVMKTSMGDVTIELNSEKAPESVENFLRYVDEDAYDGTIFHRVISGFMNQGGGFDGDHSKRKTHAPVSNEADNGLKNDRGTIAMARTNQPHSATNQFFINTVDNGFLNHTSKSMRGWGYAVFGKVTEGMEVMDRLAKVQTTRGKLGQNMPREAVVIKSIDRAE